MIQLLLGRNDRKRVVLNGHRCLSCRWLRGVGKNEIVFALLHGILSRPYEKSNTG
jgi:hypothetical protein